MDPSIRDVDAHAPALALTRPHEPAGDTAEVEVHRLTSLLAISRALAGAATMKAALHTVLELLARHHGAVRGLVTLRGADGRLVVEAADGVDRSDASVTYAVAEGLIRRVVETGRAVVVPSVGTGSPGHPSRRRQPWEQGRSFVCVPIRWHRTTLGALALDVTGPRARDGDRADASLDVVASMLAQAIHVQQRMDAERERLEAANTALQQQLRARYDVAQLIGTCAEIRHVYEQLAQIANADTPVLIRGEAGTGKARIAHAIHYTSWRATTPFATVTCAGRPALALEALLFGHEPGAFPGADTRTPGAFERADGGTLFLDEIGELGPTTQVKLLRVLQSREFERVGGTETIKANVRLLAATRTELERAVAQGTFSEDLYYRLHRCALVVPPLRARGADLLLLADHFLDTLARHHGKAITRLSAPALDALTHYPWPGNVRELEHAIDRAVRACEGAVIHVHHLPAALRTADADGPLARPSLQDALQAYEREVIQDALTATDGRRAKAARLLDTTERILNYRIRKLGVDYGRFKRGTSPLHDERRPPRRRASTRVSCRDGDGSRR